jgi:hypothetical protein
MPNVRCIVPAMDEPTGEGTALDPTDKNYVISNHNRWSRAALSFEDLTGDTWCELSFTLIWHSEEENRNVSDFMAIGIDFLTEDGSSIDFTYVPGLTRTLIDPYCCYIPGPDYHSQSSSIAHTGKIYCTFLVPSPAKHLTVTFRSWRNSHPFTVSDPRLHQIAQGPLSTEQSLTDLKAQRETQPVHRRTWRSLTHVPIWSSYAIAPGHPLFIRGQLMSERMTGEGALVRVIFRDAQGEQLPPPYAGIADDSELGAYIDIPAHRRTRRFTLELSPPAQAATVDLGFQVRQGGASVNLTAPLEVSLGEDLLLESIAGEDHPDVLNYVREALERLEQHPDLPSSKDTRIMDLLAYHADLLAVPTIQDNLRNVQRGETATFLNGQLNLHEFPAWSLSEAPDWTEDPFQSPTWRLEYQSLSWLLDLANTSNASALSQAVDLAVSWSQANLWGSPRDALSSDPLSMAVRAEVFVRLVVLSARAKKAIPDKKQEILIAEMVRHGFALAEIVGQNLFLHSIIHIRAACALLTISRAISRFPLAMHWKSVALVHLRNGLELMLDPEGSSLRQSPHYRLELISLGLILIQSLESSPESEELQRHMTPLLREHLRVIVAITDPAGMLPPFGDMPSGHHHASWIRRLISGYGRSFLLEPKLVEELTYPTGPRVFMSESAGLVALRHYEHKSDWSYLCASFGENRHENGHHDCTSFVYSSRGVRWVTDSGGPNRYDTEPERQYLLSSRAHNVAIPDGREQTPGNGWVHSHISLENVNVLQLGTNVYGPSYTHFRTYICLADLHSMAVFDQFIVDQRPVSCEGLLHFDEDIAVALANAKQVLGLRGRRRLQVTPHVMTGKFGGMNIENGRSEPAGSFQGFISDRNGDLKPANVLHYRFSGYGNVCGGVILTTDQQGLETMSQVLLSPTIKSLLESQPIS